MAGARPQFLMDLIQQHNADNNKSATIPFNILEETLKKLIYTFTTVFFTKLNYPEIFASPATIPPIQTHNRLQFCINLARLHLYLSDNYQAINYIKFAEDIKLRPKRFNIASEIIKVISNINFSSSKWITDLILNLISTFSKLYFLKNTIYHL
jgi:hypothetical protein